MGGLGENERPYHEQRRPFFSLFTDIFSENRTSEDVKTFFCSSNQCEQTTYRASHGLSPALTTCYICDIKTAKKCLILQSKITHSECLMNLRRKIVHF